MIDLDPKDQQKLIKEAIKEWMDEQYANVGRWFIKSLAVAGMTSFLFWYIQFSGHKFP